MSIAVEFSKELGVALSALAEDEWAVVSLRERVVKGLDPATAYSSITDVLKVAQAQTDSYAFASCCLVAASLAEVSNTTEKPPGLVEALQQALIAAKPLGAESEVRRVVDWYRIRALPA